MTLDGFGGDFGQQLLLWETLREESRCLDDNKGSSEGALKTPPKGPAAKRLGLGGALLDVSSLDTKDISAQAQPHADASVAGGVTSEVPSVFAPGDRRRDWTLPLSEDTYRRAVTSWDYTWIDYETGEMFDRDESVAGHVGHEIVCRVTVRWATGRGKNRQEHEQVFEHPAGLKEPGRPSEPGRCLGCGAELPGEKPKDAGTKPVDDPRGWVFAGRRDGRRCQVCAAAIWPMAPVTRRYRALPRAQAEEREAAAQRKRRNKSSIGAVGSLSREFGCTQEEAKALLDAGLPEKKKRFTKDGRIGKVRNKPCPCGSGKKFKACCFDEPHARGLAKRAAAQRALVAKLIRVGAGDRAARVRKCRSRFLCGVCRTPGCASHGKAKKIAAPVFMCGDRLCPWCAHAASNRLTNRIVNVTDVLVQGGRLDARWLSTVTLTVRNTQGEIAGAWAWLRAAYLRLMHLIALKFPCPECRGSGRREEKTPRLVLSIMGADGQRRTATRQQRHAHECPRCCGGRSVVEGSIRCLETTASPEAGWHPHVHAVWIHRTPIPQAALSAAWLVATEGEGYVANLHRVVQTPRREHEEVRDAVRETTKYETKVLEVPDSHVLELTDALKGEHLRDTFGLLRGVDLEGPDDDEDGLDERTTDLGACDDCSKPLKEETVWLWGARRFKALRESGENVWQGALRREYQERLPGPMSPPPEWRMWTRLGQDEIRCVGPWGRGDLRT